VGSSVASAASTAVTPSAPFLCGTSTVPDNEGNTYPTVSIGTQCWTKENLKVTKYNDGTPIDFDNSGGMDGISGGYNPNPWYTRSAGAFTIYANDGITGTNATNYGFLYNWFAAADPRKLCPAGWHVPTDPDWTTLIEFHGGISGNIPTLFSASPKMKQKGTTLWNNPNNGTDDFGFTALPAGLRFGGTNQFADLKSNAYFWSATEGTLSGSLIWISSNGPVNFLTQIKTYGYSVRCLRD
jgi:uncharacterized protein (TIGR02145 family)